MHPYRTPLALWSSALLLVACGGGDTPETAEVDPQAEYVRLSEAAALSLTQAQALATSTPCAQTSQCTTLQFDAARTPCENPPSIDYSLASPTAAAASAAAAEYGALRREAEALGVGPALISGCFQNVGLLDPLQCIENQCVRAPLIIIQGP